MGKRGGEEGKQPLGTGAAKEKRKAKIQTHDLDFVKIL